MDIKSILVLLVLLVFDPCYARATVVRVRFWAAAFSDGFYLAHINGAYLRHVKSYFSIMCWPALSLTHSHRLDGCSES